MGSVREFGQAIVKPMGAPAGPVGTYVEVPFKTGEKTCYPDGLLGSTTSTQSSPPRQPPGRGA